MFFKKKTPFQCPMSGKYVSLEEVPDPVFSQKLMGDGFAVELTEGMIVAPCDVKVLMCYPTGHAIGLQDKKGNEFLFHIGLDTVKLNGDGFNLAVQPGQEVSAGELLMNVDIDLIKNNGYSLISPVIFTNCKVKIKNPAANVSRLDQFIEVL